MPTIITHGIVGFILGKTSTMGRKRLFWVLMVVCAILPDIDVVTFRFGVRYGDLLGHRGLSHSLFFAVLASLSAMLIYARHDGLFSRHRWACWPAFFLAAVSHPVLDAMTDGGMGVALLAPFDDRRYFFPFRPIHVSPISISRFFTSGFGVIVNEIFWVWVPVIVLSTMYVIVRRGMRAQRTKNAASGKASITSHSGSTSPE